MSDQQQDSSSSSTSAAANSSAVNVQNVKSQLANRFQANKPLVLKLHSILTWEQEIYPVCVVAFVSILFFFIYLLKSSILTTLSYLGIAVALLDLALPTIAKTLASVQPGKPNDKDNQRFDKICLDLAKAYAFVRCICDSCCAMKTKSPKLYYPALLTFLLMSAFIGNKFNNLFLTYLFVLTVALYPGLDKRGIPQKAVEFVFAKIGRRPPAFLCGSSSQPTGGDRKSSGKRN